MSFIKYDLTVTFKAQKSKVYTWHILVHVYFGNEKSCITKSFHTHYRFITVCNTYIYYNIISSNVILHSG